jgi:hypothetical protein
MEAVKMQQKLKELQEKLNYFSGEIEKPEFLQMRGLGNEVPYFIFDYDPAFELIVRDYIKNTARKSSVKIEVINLFDLMLSLFEDVGIDELIEIEEEEGTEELFESMSPVMEDDELIDAIEEKINGSEIVFLTHTGSVYPLVRAHDVLNRLAERNLRVPLVLFYPGQYSGQDLKLFNRFRSDNYYRAFGIQTVK